MSAIDPAAVRERSTPVPGAGSAGSGGRALRPGDGSSPCGLPGGASLVPSSAHAAGGEGRPSAAGHPSPRPMAPRVPRAGSRPRPRTGRRSAPDGTAPGLIGPGRAGDRDAPGGGARPPAVRRGWPHEPLGADEFAAPAVARPPGATGAGRPSARALSGGTTGPPGGPAERCARRPPDRRDAPPPSRPVREDGGTRRVRAPFDAAKTGRGDARCAACRPCRSHRNDRGAGRPVRGAGPGAHTGDSRDRS